MKHWLVAICFTFYSHTYSSYPALDTADPAFLANTTVESRKTQPTDPTITKKRILSFGDSLTRGLVRNGQLYHPYTSKLSELLNAGESGNGTSYLVYNEGVRRECAETDMMKRLPSLLERYLPLDLIIIFAGTNDLTARRCPRQQELFDVLRQLHEMCHHGNAKTVAVTIPEAGEKWNKWNFDFDKQRLRVNARLREFAVQHKQSVILCDLANKFPMSSLPEEQQKLYWQDYLHATAKGYDKIGAIIYQCVRGKF